MKYKLKISLTSENKEDFRYDLQKILQDLSEGFTSGILITGSWDLSERDG